MGFEARARQKKVGFSARMRRQIELPMPSPCASLVTANLSR